MSPILLEILFRVWGVGAASGLVVQGDQVHLISDDSNFLYSYSMRDSSLSARLIVQADPQNQQLPKNLKRDFEALTYYQDSLYIYGSGSSTNAQRNFRVRLTNEFLHCDSVQMDALPELEDWTDQYKRMQVELGISSEDFNIEGVIHQDSSILLFNRGNGPLGKNGIIKWTAGQALRFFPLELPLLANVKTGFTDAIQQGAVIYFLATAEDADSVYEDGLVQGSILGKLDANTLTLLGAVQISTQHKFEGLSIWQENAQFIDFLLCEDPDRGDIYSDIYRLRIKK